jgi:enoyl-CoA hydratase/carnithine racemase
LPAEQAAEWGLIWQCVDDDQLKAVTDKLLAQLAEGTHARLRGHQDGTSGVGREFDGGAARSRA